MRLYLLPQKRLRAYILWISLVIVGITIGFLRAPTASPTLETITGMSIAGAVGELAGATALRSATTEPPPAKQDESIRLVSYTVESGDTLSSIAQKFNTSSDSIAYINSLSSPDRISIGLNLLVMENASGVVVKIASGDTLSGICQEYGVKADEIMNVNNLANADSLSIGQTLLLPGATPSRATQTLSRSNSLSWPVRGSITSPYGWRVHPVYGGDSFHTGIDIAASLGTKIGAAAAGKVTFVGWSGDYGRLIIIDHGGGIETYYAHLNSYNVSDGDQVSAGQVIGYVGESGDATGPHLHFEVRKNGSTVNPRNYLP